MPKERGEDEAERRARTPYDLNRYHLEKLQQNPNKLVTIPPRHEDVETPASPDYARNVVGSTAAARSSDFHSYRKGRRKEMARLDNMEKEYEEQKLDEEFQQRAEKRKRVEDEKLQKNRLKRQRKKQREKELKAMKKSEEQSKQGSAGDTNSDSSDEENVRKSDDE